MKKLLLSVIAAAGALAVNAATPTLNWAYLLDNSANGEYTYSLAKTTDGFVSLNLFGTKEGDDVTYAGEKIGNGATTSANSQNNNLIVIKHSNDGKKVWAVYSTQGDFDLSSSDINVTSDGGVLLFTKVRGNVNTVNFAPVLIDASNDTIDFPDFSLLNRAYSTVLVKITKDGNVDWYRQFDLDETPVPDATANYASYTSNGVFSYGLTLDGDGNIFIGGNFRTPYIFTGEKNSHYVLQPRNLSGYTGDVQSAAGGLFLVKLNKDGEYIGNVKVSGSATRDQICGLAYDSNYVYFYGNVKGDNNSTITLGDKSITLENNVDGILYGRINASDLSVDYFNHIKAFNDATKGTHTTQCKNIRVIDGNLYLMGHLVGGFGVAGDEEARITSSGNMQEGYLIKLNASTGAWVSATCNKTYIGGYYDVFKNGNDIYVYGYRLNKDTGVFIDKFTDNDKWENVERTSLITQGGSPSTASGVIFDSTTGDIIVSARGNNAFTFVDGTTSAAPGSWGSVIASFNLEGKSGVSDATTNSVASYSADKHSVIVKTSEETDVTVYNTAGVKVAAQKVAPGTTHIALPAGIYIVNNTKLIVG
jgi:hypothetical protein